MAVPVLAVPKWVTIVRGIQLFLAVVVLGLSAYGVYWIAFNSWGFAIFTSLATLIIVLYGILTVKITAWNNAYNFWAVVALDALAAIFWLSAMGSLAATRAAFVIPTYINGCGNNGSIGGGYCYKRNLARRDTYVATHGYLSMMSAAAGLSGLLTISFVVTLVMNAMALHRHRKAGHAETVATNDKLESHSMAPVQQPAPEQPIPVQYEQPNQQAPQQYQQQQQQQYPPQPYHQ